MSSEVEVEQLTLLQNRKEQVASKLPSVCRTCLRGECDIDMLDNELYQIDEIFLEETEITTQIQSFDEVLCLFIDNEIGKQNGMSPKIICLACVEKARSAFHFIEMCRQTDGLLDECFLEMKSSPSEVTATGSMKDEICSVKELSPEQHRQEFQQTDTKNVLTEEFESRPFDKETPKEEENPIRNKSPKRHTCDICQKTFTQPQTLNRHKKIHTKDTEPGTPCSYCNRLFLRADDLRRHIRIHTNERPYACGKCPRAYKQSFELKEHRESAHPPGARKTLQCNICDKKLTTRNGLYIHMKVHRGEKNHVCSYCDKRFVTSGELTSHQKHVHTSEVNAELLACGIDNCNRAFVTKSALRLHQTNKHFTN